MKKQRRATVGAPARLTVAVGFSLVQLVFLFPAGAQTLSETARVQVTQWSIVKNRIYFELTNDGKLTARRVQVRFTTELDGEVVHATIGFDHMLLGPGDRLAYWAVFRDKDGNSVRVPANARVRHQVRWLDTARPRPTLVTELRRARLTFPFGDGFLEASARITNRGNGPLRSPIRVFWGVYDKETGRLIVAGDDLVSLSRPLPPGGAVRSSWIGTLPAPFVDVPPDKRAQVAAKIMVRPFAFAEYQPGGLGLSVQHPALRKFPTTADFSVIGRDSVGSTVLSLGYGRYRLSRADKGKTFYLESILGDRLVIPPDTYDVTVRVRWRAPLFGIQTEQQTQRVKVAPGKISTVRFFEGWQFSPVPSVPWVSVRVLPYRPAAPAAIVGREIELQLRVKNEGPAEARIMLEHGPFQSGSNQTSALVRALRVSPSRGTARTVTEWDIGTLKPGEHATATVRLRAARTGVFEYRAHVRSGKDAILGGSDSLRVRVANSFVAGRVEAIDAQGRSRPLEHVMVLLAPPSRAKAPFLAYSMSDDERRVFTDSKGYFVFADPKLRNYVLGVVLRDQHGGIKVAMEGLEIEGAAGVLTRAHEREAAKVHRIVFDNGWDGFSAHVTADGAKHEASSYLPRFRQAALVFTDLHQCAHFAAESLRAPVFPKSAPQVTDMDVAISAVIFAKSTEFRPQSGLLRVQGSTAANPWQGTAQTHEYHEMGHAIHWISLLSGHRRLPERLSGDKNHAGVLNKDSTDSFVEGMAHFFAALVRGRPELVISTEGRKINLQQNMFWTKVWDEKQEKLVLAPDEEYNVAALLWDLYDDDAEPGDYLALGYDGIASLLNGRGASQNTEGNRWRQVRNVRTLFLFLANNGYREQDLNRNGLRDLDELFALHGFYDDAMPPLGKWTPREEPAGFGHRWNDRTRKSPPPSPGAGLQYRFRQPLKHPVTFRIAVRFPASKSERGYDFMVTAKGAGGVLRVFAPPDSEQLVIVPLVPGFVAQPLRIATAEYWRRVEQARRTGVDVFLKHEFVLEQSTVRSPESFEHELQPDHAVKLRWDMPEGVDRALLVRRADRFAECLTDGELVYVGSGNVYVDVDVYPGGSYYYVLFAASGGSLSRPVRTQVVIPTTTEKQGAALEESSPGPRERNTSAEPPGTASQGAEHAQAVRASETAAERTAPERPTAPREQATTAGGDAQGRGEEREVSPNQGAPDSGGSADASRRGAADGSGGSRSAGVVEDEGGTVRRRASSLGFVVVAALLVAGVLWFALSRRSTAGP